MDDELDATPIPRGQLPDQLREWMRSKAHSMEQLERNTTSAITRIELRINTLESKADISTKEILAALAAESKITAVSLARIETKNNQSSRFVGQLPAWLSILFSLVAAAIAVGVAVKK